MRGFLVFIASGLGLGALWKRRRHHISGRQPVYGLPYDDDSSDPAAELRAKLAETKAAGGVEATAEEEVAEEASPLDPQSRRVDVHERARASMDELA